MERALQKPRSHLRVWGVGCGGADPSSICWVDIVFVGKGSLGAPGRRGRCGGSEVHFGVYSPRLRPGLRVRGRVLLGGWSLYSRA